MMTVFLSWFGGYVLIGLITALVVAFKSYLELIRSFTEEGFNRLSGTLVLIVLFWPIAVPVVCYTTATDLMYRRYKRRTDKALKAALSLIKVLSEMQILNHGLQIEVCKSLRRTTTSAIASYRKKYRI